MKLPDWARAYAAVPSAALSPPLRGSIRSQLEDFQVTEELGFELSGDGEHDYLYIEKVSANTEWVARQLAAFAEVPARDVGYSGLKDRHAVTWQWFSVPRWHQPDWSQCQIDGVTIQQVKRHLKKLRRGVHKANHFVICVRCDELAGNEQELRDRIAAIAAGGVPNYFGNQRFGRDAGNLALADDWAAGRRLPRHKRSIAISTIRSFEFNQALHAKVVDGSWNCIAPGEHANLDGSGSVFVVDQLDDTIERRCREMDIHPSLELAGDGSNLANQNWQRALDRARVQPARRSTRIGVRRLAMDLHDDRFSLQFSLPRGAYATAVLREIVETG